MAVAIGLIIFAIVLFIVAKIGWIHNDTIQLAANIATIVALLAAIAVFVFPAAMLPDTISTEITFTPKPPTDIVISVPINTLQPPTPISTRTSISVLPTAKPFLFEENFEDGLANGIAEKSGYWRVIADESGNRVYDIDNTKGPGWPEIVFGSLNWENYAVEYRFKILDLEEATGIMLGFRQNADGTVYYTQAIDPYWNKVTLAINAGTGWQNIQEKTSRFDKERWYSVRVEAQGSQIRVFLDDVLIIEATDSRLEQGRLGLSTSPGFHLQFDDIHVRALK